MGSDQLSAISVQPPAFLLESFRRNGRVNAAVLDAISEADLDLSDGRGGYAVGTHLGHCVEFRREWLRVISPPHMEAVPDVMEGTEPTFQLRLRGPGELASAFEQADGAALEAVQAALQQGSRFERAYQSDPAHFLQHTIVHDSHHRGQVFTLLRQGGRSAQQMEALEQATWPIWRE